MAELKVLSVFGTRPEAIKMAPLALELNRHPEIKSYVCVTAQHRELLDGVLQVFGIVPDYDLNIMAAGQSLSDVTIRVLRRLEQTLREVQPDLVLVHGDTTTSFAGALAAFYAGIPVGHVEAGLRSGDPRSPFPEEMNRRLTADLATFHFAPTAANRDNLRNEGVTENVFVTGNTVIDAMRYTVGDKHADKEASGSGRRLIVLTCHRRENYGEPMENIFHAVRDIALRFDDVEFVYPVHPAPTVREAAGRILGNVPHVQFVEPLDAVEMHRLMARSYMVMTDSGGLQEEAPALGKPVLVLRRETERPEAIAAGTAKLAGVDREVITALASELLLDSAKYAQMANAVNPYGDGNACKRIADAILYGFSRRETPPEEFRP